MKLEILFHLMTNMTDKNYVAPQYGLDWFNCPHCWAFAHHNRYDMTYWHWRHEWLNLKISICARCERYCIWNTEKDEMIRPNISTAPLPNEDMPDDVKELYEEARKVSPLSPRAAAALLRVSLEKLTAHLWETEWNLNTRIWNLRKKGLPDNVIKSLDIVRITANEWWSHSWEIDLTWADNQWIVNRLFFLVNYIVDRIITNDKIINESYLIIPEDKLKGIENRDSN